MAPDASLVRASLRLCTPSLRPCAHVGCTLFVHPAVEDQRVRQVACAGSIAVLLMESGKVAWCKVGSDSRCLPSMI